ncbi:L-threonine 3-dehydrogenase [Lederbergia sp. NSJ-179]|uniref:L-threonine 3-dehydrogenase n=1 Tax=Lederbergia sp. NSJ-179 TaxID=2931402 RepID=UPI001FD2C8CA|nr:L-threonine 3-dehydrogenase [Lederbergia sp. NSJ-179]MCJ7841556.1 L-threonine 3-dehydrogenase [Lederbergia sp. NSJ-179]
MKKILVTGALGQIGSELIVKLRNLYGENNVIATDIRKNDSVAALSGPFKLLDVADGEKMFQLAKQNQVDAIIHLAAMLSAVAEKKPLAAWHLNMGGLINALETAKELGIQLFAPSSIGSFGPTTPKDKAPQDTIQRPTSMYGVNKVAGELLCDYYFARFGVDTRGVRFPGLISYVTPPGGGTTDYAVEIYYDAVEKGRYQSFINKGTYMDMMFMPDALEAVVQLMEADPAKLQHRNAYNITAMSLEPEEIATEIRKHIPSFVLDYQVDPARQAIADSWPNSIDDSAAREEWGFRPQYNLEKMTADMLEKIREKAKV